MHGCMRIVGLLVGLHGTLSAFSSQAICRLRFLWPFCSSRLSLQAGFRQTPGCCGPTRRIRLLAALRAAAGRCWLRRGHALSSRSEGLWRPKAHVTLLRRPQVQVLPSKNFASLYHSKVVKNSDAEPPGLELDLAILPSEVKRPERGADSRREGEQLGSSV